MTGTPLSTYTTGRDNNFNLIRFIAASLVLFTHSFILSQGTEANDPLTRTIGLPCSWIGVDIFFIISGFLVTSSYFTRKNLFAYLWARVLRIYPALMINAVFCVFVIGAYFTTFNIQEYLLNDQTHKYFIRNSILFWDVEFNLPGVFTNNPYKDAVNGSLWTLPSEVKLYAILAGVLFLFTSLGRRFKLISIRNIVSFLCVFSVGLNLFYIFYNNESRYFVRFFSLFFSGAALFIWRDKIYLYSKWVLLVLIILIASAIDKHFFYVLYSLLLPYLVLCAAYLPSGKIRKFKQIGDYSYGMYIYTFPVQQSIATIVPHISVAEMLVSSFSVTLFFAALSWHLIEKRALQMKGHIFSLRNF
jgi:peptidoglycan/LPS O-acetylase OafA/YrhL